MEQLYNRELRMRILLGKIDLPLAPLKAAEMLRRVELSLSQYSLLLQENPQLEGRLTGIVNRGIKNNKFYRVMNVLDKFFSKYMLQSIGVN